MARTLFRSSAILAAANLLFLGGCGDDAPAAKDKEAPRVTVVHPVTRSLTDEAEYNGWLEAYKTVDVCPRVGGYIKKVHFKDGDMVKEGAALFDIDPDPFAAQLAQITAQKEALKAQYDAALNVVARNEELIKTNAVSRQELEKSVADKESFRAQIRAKEADADRVNLDLKYAKIVAPLTGKVGKANFQEGAMVTATGIPPVLTTIVSVDPIYVDFNVDERAVQRYKQAEAAAGSQTSLRERKTKITFGLDTDDGFPRKATLVFGDIKFAEGTGTVLVRGQAENKQGQLVPGSRVRVRVPVGEKYTATLVPDAAVCTDQKMKYLLSVGDDKKVQRIGDVKLGRLLDDGMRVILSPELKADVSIISEGMERVRRDQPVEPVPEPPPANSTAK